MIEVSCEPELRDYIASHLEDYFGEGTSLKAIEYSFKNRKRVDIVAIQKDTIFLIEVKITADRLAILQVTQYLEAYNNEDNLKVVPVVIALRFSDKIGDYAETSGVTLIKVDNVEHVQKKLSIVVKLREVVERKNITYGHLVNLSGVSKHTINSLLVGESRSIDVNTLDKLCTALNCEPGDLLQRTR